MYDYPKVKCSNPTTPLLLMFGPVSCGKSMIATRLYCWLRKQGYKACCARDFLDSKYYNDSCDNFNNRVYSHVVINYPADVLSLNICDSQNNLICQTIEVPWLFHLDTWSDTPEIMINTPFTSFAKDVFSFANPKIWCIIIDPVRNDINDRIEYVKKTHELGPMMSHRDKVIFIYNKVDCTPFCKDFSCADTKAAYKDVEQNYPKIFTHFRKKHWIFGWRDKFELVPFQTGVYSLALDGGKVFTAGHDNYPKQLWEIILRHLKELHRQL